MRYVLTTETIKDGRKKLVQHCVFDTHEGRVIARYAKEKDAQAVIDRYKALTLAASEA